MPRAAGVMSAQGYLIPNSIAVPPSWRDPAKMASAVSEAVAALRANSKAAHGPKLVIFQAVSRLTDLERPLPGYLLDALATALRLNAKQKRDDTAVTARNLRGQGLTNREIAERLGLSKRTVQRHLGDGEAATGWTCADEVLASVASLMGGSWPLKARQYLYDAMSWFAERSMPLPYGVWWAVACALGLGRRDKGLTPDTVRALSGGIIRSSARDAVAAAIAKARAEGKRAPSVSELANIADKADGGPRLHTADLVREWTARPGWEWAVLSREIIARQPRRG